MEEIRMSSSTTNKAESSTSNTASGTFHHILCKGPRHQCPRNFPAWKASRSQDLPPRRSVRYANFDSHTARLRGLPNLACIPTTRPSFPSTGPSSPSVYPVRLL
jgi:hypothetical protein